MLMITKLTSYYNAQCMDAFTLKLQYTCLDSYVYVTGPAKINHVSTNYIELYFC